MAWLSQLIFDQLKDCNSSASFRSWITSSLACNRRLETVVESPVQREMVRALATEKNGRTNRVRLKIPITFLANIFCSFLTLASGGEVRNFFGTYRCSLRPDSCRPI